MAPTYIPLLSFREYPPEEMIARSAAFLADSRRRRTIRQFSERDLPRIVVENCLAAAATAPNGANLQPWHFVVVADPSIKRRVREAAEAEEYDFYTRRAPREWLDALAPLGTDHRKPFLETAPYLIVIFARKFGVLPDGRTVKHYYAQESVGIATGILITALHYAGVATLTHTPSPMHFPRVCGRNEVREPAAQAKGEQTAPLALGLRRGLAGH